MVRSMPSMTGIGIWREREKRSQSSRGRGEFGAALFEGEGGGPNALDGRDGGVERVGFFGEDLVVGEVERGLDVFGEHASLRIHVGESREPVAARRQTSQSQSRLCWSLLYAVRGRHRSSHCPAPLLDILSIMLAIP